MAGGDLQYERSLRTNEDKWQMTGFPEKNYLLWTC